MKSIAHAAPGRRRPGSTEASHARNVALDRARTFLTLVVLLHHAVIPYTYFGHTDPTSWIGFDCVVLATDSFFMAMFFFLSGLFVLARARPQAVADLPARPAAAARPAVRDLRRHRDSARLLGDRTAPRAGDQLRRILAEDHDRRPVAERPDLVRLGADGLRRHRERCCTGCRRVCSIPSTARRSGDLNVHRSSGCSSLSSAPPPTCRCWSHYGQELLVRTRAVFGTGQPRVALCVPISSLAPGSGRQISRAASSARTDG